MFRPTGFIQYPSTPEQILAQAKAMEDIIERAGALDREYARHRQTEFRLAIRDAQQMPKAQLEDAFACLSTMYSAAVNLVASQTTVAPIESLTAEEANEFGVPELRHVHIDERPARKP